MYKIVFNVYAFRFFEKLGVGSGVRQAPLGSSRGALSISKLTFKRKRTSERQNLEDLDLRFCMINCSFSYPLAGLRQ